MKCLWVLLVGFLAGGVSAITLDSGVSYDCGDTDFNMSMDVIVTNLQLFDQQIVLNDSSFSVTQVSGTTNVTIHPYDSSIRNFTIENSESSTVTFTLSDLSASTAYNVYQDGALEDQTITNGAGLLIYTSASFSGSVNYLILETAGAFILGLTSPDDLATFEYAPGLEVNYTATATSPNTVINVSLYDNRSGSWAFRYINVTAGDGTKALGGASSLNVETILWGAYGCDQSTCAWTDNRTYSVVDTTAPVITITLNTTTLEADRNDCLIGNYSVTDYFIDSSVARIMDSGFTTYATNTSINGTITFCYDESGGLDTYNFNVTSSDSNGNTAIENQTFIIQDTIAPVLTLTLNVTSIEAGRDCIQIDGHASDTFIDTYSLNVSNSSGQLAAYNISNGGDLTFCYDPLYGFGVYRVNLTATDSSSNYASTNKSFDVVHDTTPTVEQVTPADLAFYTLGQLSTTLICNATTYIPMQNFTFDFNGTGNVTNSTVSAGNQSSLGISWGSSAFDTYNWSCGGYDIFGNYSSTGLRTFTYANSTTTLNCSWMSGAINGTVFSSTFTNDGVNVTILANSSRRYSQIYCTLLPKNGDCIYGAGNVSSIKFPVSNVSMDSCNVTAYTPKGVMGNLTIPIYYDPAYNDTNLNINWSAAQYVRRYYFNESSGLIF